MTRFVLVFSLVLVVLVVLLLLTAPVAADPPRHSSPYSSHYGPVRPDRPGGNRFNLYIGPSYDYGRYPPRLHSPGLYVPWLYPWPYGPYPSRAPGWYTSPPYYAEPGSSFLLQIR